MTNSEARIGRGLDIRHAGFYRHWSFVNETPHVTPQGGAVQPMNTSSNNSTGSAETCAGDIVSASVYDEMMAADGSVRPHWREFDALMQKLGADELSRRWEQADRLIRENGMTYNAFGDANDAARPWELDSFPLLISANEWRVLSAGLVQRAQLLNRVLADIYGPQRLLTAGLLPANLIFSHPGFMRPFHGQRPRDNTFLHFYAVDLARASDGRWWVVSDRTDAPLGVGYALENRIVVSRMLPGVVRQCNIERLAPFFLALRDTLQRLAPERRENPRIVLLTPGPTTPNHFEDAYLARYLGYTLVEGGDLAVRDDRVYLKTLGGLLQVDVVFRRLGDGYCDPLELPSDPALGVPGLLQAVQAGNVAVANALGSSVVESAAFIPFLPGLCRQLLGQDLKLPSVATWWCGTGEARDYVLANLDRLMIRSAYRLDRRDPMAAELLGETASAELAAAIRASAANFVGQEEVTRSTAPVSRSTAVEPLHVALRAFLVASGDSYTVLPGGLVRVAAKTRQLNFSILAGEGSKDTWVLADQPVPNVTLQPTRQAVELRRGGAELPSRVADNLFWLGRHVERAEGAARLLRPVLVRLTSEAEATSIAELAILLRCLAAQGQIEPGFVVEGVREQLPRIETALPAAVLDDQQPGNLRSTIAALYRTASLVRDRLSSDSWRIIHRIQEQVDSLADQTVVELSDVLELINRTIIDLAAFDGLVVESMTRTLAWRFLDLGRRFERALYTISLVQTGLDKPSEGQAPILEAMLEVADSLMTYRARYLATVQWAPVLDLLLTDETNPRSLAYQLVTVADHVEELPRDRTQPLRDAEQRIAIWALDGIRLVDFDVLSEKRKPKRVGKLERFLAELAEQLPRLSDLISHKYLVHSDVPRQLSEQQKSARV